MRSVAAQFLVAMKTMRTGDWKRSFDTAINSATFANLTE